MTPEARNPKRRAYSSHARKGREKSLNLNRSRVLAPGHPSIYTSASLVSLLFLLRRRRYTPLSCCLYFFLPYHFRLFPSITMSSNDSLGFISDDLLSRSADDDWEQLAVRPLDESVGDDAFSGSVPVLRESPRSSTAGSSAAVDELRRRDSLSCCDPLGSGSALSGSFIPRLGDEELDDVKTDESTSDETVPGPYGVAGPSADVVDYFGPTRTSSKSLANALRSCSAPPSISVRIPSMDERPWTTPEGYICVYESFFTDCGLVFPIPKFLLEYVARREMAISQLSIAAIRNAIGLVRLAARCGVEIRLAHYEEATYFKSLGKKKPGLYYVQSATTPRLVDEAKSKVHDWSGAYFFVKISEDSVEDLQIPNYRGWKVSPGSLCFDFGTLLRVWLPFLIVVFFCSSISKVFGSFSRSAQSGP